MEILTHYTSVLLLVVLVLAIVAVWSPRRFHWKVFACSIAIMTFIFGFISYIDLLSRPKPVELEWVKRHAKKAIILGVDIVEDKGIYVLLKLPEFDEARYFVLPWNRNTAEQIQKGMRNSQMSGQPLIIRKPFEPSLDNSKSKFYLPPQPALPPKEHGEAPEIFEHPGEKS